MRGSERTVQLAANHSGPVAELWVGPKIPLLQEVHFQTSDSRSIYCTVVQVVSDLWDLLYVAHVAGEEPYDLHDLAHGSWVGSVVYLLRYIS